jgi:hypothetical protein
VHPIGPDGQAAHGTIAAAKGTLAASYSDTSCNCTVFETSRDGGAC